MALNLSAFRQNTGLDLSAFGIKSIPMPFTGSILRAPTAQEAAQMKPVGLGQTVRNQQTAAENLGIARESYTPIKIPFVNKQIIFPIPTSADAFLVGGLKFWAELPERIVNSAKDIYAVKVQGKLPEPPLQGQPDAGSWVRSGVAIYNEAKQKGFSENQAKALGGVYGFGSALLDVVTVLDLGATGFLKITKFNPELDGALSRMGLSGQFTKEQWRTNAENAMRNLGATKDPNAAVQFIKDNGVISKALYGEGIPQTQGMWKSAEDLAKSLKAPLFGAKPAPYSISGAPKTQLPGQATVGEPQPAFGLSIQPVKKVGGVPEVPKEPEPLAAEARNAEKVLRRTYLEAIEEGKTPSQIPGLRKAGLQEAQFTETGRGVSGQLSPQERIDLFNITKKEFTQELSKAKGLGFNNIKDYNRAQRMLEGEAIQVTNENLKKLSPIVNKQMEALRTDNFTLQREAKSQLTSFYNQAAKGVTPETGGIGGIRGLKKIGLAPEPSPKLTRTERQLLNERIRNEARGTKMGVRVGWEQAREAITNQLRNTFDTKITEVKRGAELAKFKERILGRDADRVRLAIVDYVKERIPASEQGKFISMVKNARTQKDLIKSFIRIDQKAGEIVLKQSIGELKRTAESLSESPAVSADYRNKIKDIIGQYELTGHTEATIEKLKATQVFLDKAKANGEDIEIPQRILDKLKILSRIPKDKLTLNQVEGLQNEIELLGKLGETKWASKQALYDAEKEARKKVLLETASAVNSNVLPQNPIGTETSKWAQRYIAARNFLQKSRIGLTPIDGLADITGMHPMKAALDLNYGNYLTYNDASIKEWYELTKDFTDKEFERIGAVAISRQEGGIERLANSGRTQAEIDAIKLTPEEEKAYQLIRSKFEVEFPAVKKYAMDVYNADVGQVNNYVSFMSDFDAMSDLEVYERFGQRAEEIAGRRTKTVEQGFTKSRAQVAKTKLELNIDKIFRRHLDDVAYMLTSGRDIKQYFEIVNSPEMKAKLGDTGALAWLQYLDLMARKGGTEGAKRIAALDVIRKNIGAGVLAFRLSSAVVQFSSFADTIGTIGAEWATKGAMSISTSKEWRNFIMDNFPEIKKAVGDDIAFREFGDGLFGSATRIGFKPLQVMDGVMRSVAAAGSYQKLAFEKGTTIDLANPDKALIQEATRLMRQSQGSSFFKDQPLAITAGYGLSDNRSINKTILTFQSFMLNRWDNIQRQVWRLGIKEKNYKKATSAVFWTIIFAAALEEGLRRGTRQAIDFLTGDDQEEKSFAGNVVLNAVQAVPIMGQLVSSITYSSNPVPVINSFEDALSGIESVVKGKALETKARGAVQALGAAGSLAGVPGASQGTQIIRKAIPQANANSSAATTLLQKYGIKSQNVGASAILDKYGIK